MTQTIAIKQVSLRQFSRAVGRYLKQCPIQVVDAKGVGYDIFLSDKTPGKVSDKPDLSDKREPTGMPDNFKNGLVHKHACGCKVKESKLCKEHGRF